MVGVKAYKAADAADHLESIISNRSPIARQFVNFSVLCVFYTF